MLLWMFSKIMTQMVQSHHVWMAQLHVTLWSAPIHECDKPPAKQQTSQSRCIKITCLLPLEPWAESPAGIRLHPPEQAFKRTFAHHLCLSWKLVSDRFFFTQNIHVNSGPSVTTRMKTELVHKLKLLYGRPPAGRAVWWQLRVSRSGSCWRQETRHGCQLDSERVSPSTTTEEGTCYLMQKKDLCFYFHFGLFPT